MVKWFMLTFVRTIDPRSPLEDAIEVVGGVGKLAAELGLVPSAVSNWLARGTTPEPIHCTAIERATTGIVTRRDLRPRDWQQIWPELAAPATEGEGA